MKMSAELTAGHEWITGRYVYGRLRSLPLFCTEISGRRSGSKKAFSLRAAKFRHKTAVVRYQSAIHIPPGDPLKTDTYCLKYTVALYLSGVTTPPTPSAQETTQIHRNILTTHKTQTIIQNKPKVKIYL